MPAPSQLSIATSAVTRLVKEEASYHKELEHQLASIAKLEQGNDEDENAEYVLRQERKAVEETKAIFPQLKQKITDALARLEQKLEQASGDETPAEEITKAKEAVAAAKTVVCEAS
ncbi:Hypothetical protein R9X50_00777500 [Acrodontium crateriforme]|uniref:Tubulin-specific chaperone A n=1 Tax=Acrodontium crateriforme TaxID=150365 RepID=A0AAQ3MCA0_9PEZI|nr:Hypothetical protein R9X50_00777500 [Acrodontium crateriforme]